METCNKITANNRKKRVKIPKDLGMVLVPPGGQLEYFSKKNFSKRFEQKYSKDLFFN